jgi:hypothetical protein
MTPSPSRKVRPWLVVVAVAAALVVLGGLGAFLPLAFREETGGAPAALAAGPSARPATRAEVQAALSRAATALRDGDRAAYRAALPAADKPARRALGALFRHLSPLPWTSFELTAEPITSAPGRFDVFAAGRLGRTGPDDRIGGERVLEFETRDGRVAVVHDVTPGPVQREYLMAFHDPVTVEGDGVLVLADRTSKGRAETLAEAATVANPRLRLVGVKPDEQVLVSVYSSLIDLRASLGGGPGEDRVRFFSSPAPRLSSRPWRIRDVGVLGPSLDGIGDWMPLMLAHELTHAYTGQWFAKTAQVAKTRHAPPFLMEGLATAVEGGRDWTPLKEEVASGNQLWPLADAIGTGNLWMGTSTDDMRLAYLEAASVVHFVLDRWGLAKLRPFFQAVADSDLSPDGLDEATRESLGVSWDEFYRGWLDYVPTLQ